MSSVQRPKGEHVSTAQRPDSERAEVGTKAKEQMIKLTGSPDICLGRMPGMSSGFLRAVRGQ